jgi:hypothetical protein
VEENMEENQEVQIEEPEAQVQESEAPQVSSADHNWRQAQEVMSLQKREIEALKEHVQKLSLPPQKAEEPDEFELADPDDYVTMGKAREMATKMAAREAKKEAKKIVEEYMQQQTIASDEQRMRSKFEDYDYVLENYALPLIKSDPALAYKVQTSKNPAETAYKLGRLSDSFEESTMKQTNPKAEKILKNSSRPVSSHSTTPSLREQADSYSKMTPQQVWSQAQEYAKRA